MHTLPAPGSFAYTDVFNPQWLSSKETVHEFRASLPIPNPLADAPFFSNLLILSDPLHVLWRGFCPSFVASSIVKLSRKGLWGMGNQQDRWDLAYKSATAFVKRGRRDQLAVDEFTPASMGFSEGYPEMNAKGADIKTLCYWLVN